MGNRVACAVILLTLLGSRGLAWASPEPERRAQARPRAAQEAAYADDELDPSVRRAEQTTWAEEWPEIRMATGRSQAQTDVPAEVPAFEQRVIARLTEQRASLASYVRGNTGPAVRAALQDDAAEAERFFRQSERDVRRLLRQSGGEARVSELLHRRQLALQAVSVLRERYRVMAESMERNARDILTDSFMGVRSLDMYWDAIEERLSDSYAQMRTLLSEAGIQGPVSRDAFLRLRPRQRERFLALLVGIEHDTAYLRMANHVPAMRRISRMRSDARWGAVWMHSIMSSFPFGLTEMGYDLLEHFGQGEVGIRLALHGAIQMGYQMLSENSIYHSLRRARERTLQERTLRRIVRQLLPPNCEAAGRRPPDAPASGPAQGPFR